MLEIVYPLVSVVSNGNEAAAGVASEAFASLLHHRYAPVELPWRWYWSAGLFVDGRAGACVLCGNERGLWDGRRRRQKWNRKWKRTWQSYEAADDWRRQIFCWRRTNL